MLPVEGILALHNAGVRALSHCQRGLTQRKCNVDIRYGGILDRRVFLRGMFKADGAGGDDNIAGLHVQLNAAAGADTDEGIRADVVQLLHCDGGRRAADAGRADADLLSEQGAGVDIEFPILGDMFGIVKERSDGLAPAGIAGQDAVPANISFDTVNMELFFKLLHDQHSLLSDDVY